MKSCASKKYIYIRGIKVQTVLRKENKIFITKPYKQKEAVERQPPLIE
jgi:hypothetical protein